MCIQETNFKKEQTKTKNFDIHFKNRKNWIYDSGGIVTCINKYIMSKEIILTTTLDAVASLVLLASKKICICKSPPAQ